MSNCYTIVIFCFLLELQIYLLLQSSAMNLVNREQIAWGWNGMTVLAVPVNDLDHICWLVNFSHLW